MQKWQKKRSSWSWTSALASAPKRRELTAVRATPSEGAASTMCSPSSRPRKAPSHASRLRFGALAGTRGWRTDLPVWPQSRCIFEAMQSHAESRSFCPCEGQAGAEAAGGCCRGPRSNCPPPPAWWTGPSRRGGLPPRAQDQPPGAEQMSSWDDALCAERAALPFLCQRTSSWRTSSWWSWRLLWKRRARAQSLGGPHPHPRRASLQGDHPAHRLHHLQGAFLKSTKKGKRGKSGRGGARPSALRLCQDFSAGQARPARPRGGRVQAAAAPRGQALVTKICTPTYVAKEILTRKMEPYTEKASFCTQTPQRVRTAADACGRSGGPSGRRSMFGRLAWSSTSSSLGIHPSAGTRTLTF